MSFVKKTLPLLFGIGIGLYAVAEFYLPHHNVRWLTNTVNDWGTILVAAAFLLGAVNVLQVTWPKIRRRESDWEFKVVLLVSAVVMLLVGLTFWQRFTTTSPPTVAITGEPSADPTALATVRFAGPDDIDVAVKFGRPVMTAAEQAQFEQAKTQPTVRTPRITVFQIEPGPVEFAISRRMAGYATVTDAQLKAPLVVAAGQTVTITADPVMLWGKDGRVFVWIYDHVFAPCNATMFALLAFFVASAAFRAFRARNVESALLLGAAILVLLGRAPLGRLMSEAFPMISDWIVAIPSNAGRRAIVMGAAIGAITTGLRVILGLERSHLGDD